MGPSSLVKEPHSNKLELSSVLDIEFGTLNVANSSVHVYRKTYVLAGINFPNNLASSVEKQITKPIQMYQNWYSRNLDYHRNRPNTYIQEGIV